MYSGIQILVRKLRNLFMQIDAFTKHTYIHKFNIPGFSVQASLLCDELQSWHGLDSLDWLFRKHNSFMKQWSIKDNAHNYIINKEYIDDVNHLIKPKKTVTLKSCCYQNSYLDLSTR